MATEFQGRSPRRNSAASASETGQEATPNAPAKASLHRVLGVPSLIFFGLAYMVPLTIFTTYGVVTQETQGHLPAAYIVTLAAMFFTAYSYGRMVENFPVAGSAYSYARRAFGGPVGFMVGWALLLDYIFLPLINYLVIGIFMSEYFPAVPSFVWVLSAILLVTVLNILGIKLVAKMNFIIIAFQTLFLLVFMALALATLGRDETPSLFAPFYSGDFKFSAIVAGAAILCLSFLGFDAVSTLSEETRNPRRDIPRAIMLCTLAGGSIFIVASWAGHIVFPDWKSFTNADSAALDIMIRLGGTFMTSFFTAAYIAGAFASAMASQASVARILFSMGRDKALPQRLFASIYPRFGTPVGATLVVSLISLLALVISLTTAASMISFGALAAFSFVNLSVLKIFWLDQKKRHGLSLVRYGVLPAIGFLLTLWLWTSLSVETFEIGLSWAVAGFLYLLYITRLFKAPLPELRIDEG